MIAAMCKAGNIYVFFFFSSRRRHTRLQGDWSSDVCSSDLRDREARLSQHLAKRLGLKGQPRRRRGRYHRRKIVGRQADEAIVDTGTAQVDGGTLAHFQRETSRR